MADNPVFDLLRLKCIQDLFAINSQQLLCVIRRDGQRAGGGVSNTADDPRLPQRLAIDAYARNRADTEFLQRMRCGDASGEMLGFTFAGSMSQLLMVRQPQQIGVTERSEFKRDLVDSLAGKGKSGVKRAHGFP
ncbi:hypothetical protein D3C78_1218120 [compost metagenome]